MAEKIKLVAGDSRPQLILSITDQDTGVPMNFSEVGTAVKVKLRAAGDTAVKSTMTCGKLIGLVLTDGSVNYDSPYNTPGSGGRVYMDWNPGALDTAGEYEAEIEITFTDGTIQTVYDLLKFRVREQF
jgi:hypothetical protein